MCVKGNKRKSSGIYHGQVVTKPFSWCTLLSNWRRALHSWSLEGCRVPLGCLFMIILICMHTYMKGLLSVRDWCCLLAETVGLWSRKMEGCTCIASAQGEDTLNTLNSSQQGLVEDEAEMRPGRCSSCSVAITPPQSLIPNIHISDMR